MAVAAAVGLALPTYVRDEIRRSHRLNPKVTASEVAKEHAGNADVALDGVLPQTFVRQMLPQMRQPDVTVLLGNRVPPSFNETHIGRSLRFMRRKSRRDARQLDTPLRSST
jgi:hypothetical protein